MLNVLHRVAIAQALPEAVDNGQGDRERVLELAKVLPGEDVQFYYQMGLIGRRDLPLAPDPRSGFEMVLLRMLASAPADSEDVPGVALKPLGISQATADPAPNPVAGAAMAAPAVVAAAAVVAPVAPDTIASPAAAGGLPASPRAGPAPPLAATPVAAEPAPAMQPEPVQSAPAVVPPWEEQVASPATAAVIEAAPSPALVPEPPAVQPQPAPAALPAVEIASPVDADVDDDEPPPGDYDYVGMGAESIDYDFDAVEVEQAVEPQVLPAAQPATGLAADWLELFPKLGLSGMD